MKTINFGVDEATFLAAVAMAEAAVPGFKADPKMAPAFNEEQATVEVRPFRFGRFEVRVHQPETRWDLTSTNGGPHTSKCIFMHAFV